MHENLLFYLSYYLLLNVDCAVVTFVYFPFAVEITK